MSKGRNFDLEQFEVWSLKFGVCGRIKIRMDSCDSCSQNTEEQIFLRFLRFLRETNKNIPYIYKKFSKILNIMSNHKKLFEEFPPVTTEQWEAVIEKDLKGADYNKKLVYKYCC